MNSNGSRNRSKTYNKQQRRPTRSRSYKKKTATAKLPRTGLLFVISAASGTGKTTLIKRALEQMSEIKLAVSHTTRTPRQGEVDQRDYYFVPYHQFNAIIRRGEFLEWAEVYGNRYGTSIKEIENSLSKGTDIILEIDVQGAAKVRKKMPRCRQIFILPPSMSELERRIRDRRKDNEDEIKRRISAAKDEIKLLNNYDYLIINDRLDQAARQLMAIIQAERLLTENQPELLKNWGVTIAPQKKKNRSIMEKLLGF